MRKVVIILVMLIGVFFASANIGKYHAPKENKKIEISDSIKFYIDYESNQVFLNFNEYKHEFFNYKIILNGGFDNCAFQQIHCYNENKKIEVNVFAKANGEIYVVVKNTKTNKKDTYKLV